LLHHDYTWVTLHHHCDSPCANRICKNINPQAIEGAPKKEKMLIKEKEINFKEGE
jgi:hypothetical protein